MIAPSLSITSQKYLEPQAANCRVYHNTPYLHTLALVLGSTWGNPWASVTLAGVTATCKDPQTYPKDKTYKTAYVPGKKTQYLKMRISLQASQMLGSYYRQLYKHNFRCLIVGYHSLYNNIYLEASLFYGFVIAYNASFTCQKSYGYLVNLCIAMPCAINMVTCMKSFL